MSWVADAQRPRTLLTWAPVVAVAALSQAGIGFESPWTGSDLGLAVTSLMLALPLLVRVTRPVVAAAAVGVALPVQMAMGGSLHFAAFIAVLFAAYAVGRHAAGRRTVVGVAVLLVGIVVAMRHALPAEADELVFPLFYVTAAATIGSVVRRQSKQAEDLRRLNDALVRERETAERLVLATERLRIARELHDVVAHTLTVAVIQAEACEDALDDDVERAREAARQVQAAGRRGLADLRSLVRVLRDVDTPADGPTLDDLAALGSVMAGAGMDVEVVREGDLRGLSPALERELYRIVQEALTNVLKHSAASSVRVRLCRSGAAVEVEVVDPGPAAPVSPVSGGHGLRGMAERLEPLGGVLTAGREQQGFRLHVSVPVRDEATT